MFGDGYSGWYGGAGIGVGTPVGVSGYVTKTYKVFHYDLKPVFAHIDKGLDKLKTWWNCL